MSSDQTTLYLYDTATSQRDSEATLVGSDVIFPAHVRGWSDVLDCRHTPYTEKSIEENCHFAEHVHKFYILVASSQLDSHAADA